MAGISPFGWFMRKRRASARERALQAARNWPVTTAKLLKPVLVPKDEIAEGTVAQTMQVEIPFYFTLNEGFYGGHVRSVPCSDSEGGRIMRQLGEDLPVKVRYNSANPDEAIALPEDNEGALPFTIWPN